MAKYLIVENVAELLGCSSRTIHEKTRLGTIPHRRIAGTRRCLFLEDEIDAWLDGAELVVTETAGGGRVVKPRGLA